MDGIVDSLEGVDVWENETFGAFGKLWVQTFPFTATFVSDMGGKAGKDHAFLHVGSEGAYMHTCIYSLLRALKNKKNKTKIGLMIMTMTNIFFRMTNHECLTTNHESRPVQTAEDLVELLNRNRSADVNERRTVRRRLRALHGVKVHFEVSWWTRRTVADGTRTVTVTDSEGNTTTHEETVYSTIDVELFFANGILGVADGSAPGVYPNRHDLPGRSDRICGRHGDE